MRKVVLACFALAIVSSIINGCRAEVEPAPDGHVSTNLVAPR